LGRSRGGFGTKIHLVTDSNGLPLAVDISAGQRHESLYAEPVLAAVRIRRANGRVRTRPRALAGDKGCSYQRVRRYLRRRRIRAVIPTRKDQRRRPGFDRDRYRRRNVVERCLNWLKESRALATRFDKLAVNYLATIKLAILQQYLRKLAPIDSPDRPESLIKRSRCCRRRGVHEKTRNPRRFRGLMSSATHPSSQCRKVFE